MLVALALLLLPDPDEAQSATRAPVPGAAVRQVISGRHGHVLVRDDVVCVAVRTLVTGRTVTHRFTSGERASDVVHADRDLDA